MTLHCEKTGRHWPCRTMGQARALARSLGLADWTFCPADLAPSTMRETISSSLELRNRGIDPREGLA